MSSILKALRKLEEEKAERQDTPVDIACDILRAPRRRRHSSSNGWTMAALGGVAVALLAGSLLLAFGPQRVVSVTEPTHPGPVAPRPQSTPVQKEASTALPANDPEVVEVRMTAALPSAPVEKRAPVSDLPSKTDQPASAEMPKPPLPQPSSVSPVPKAPASTPLLAISGIAFQPERQERMAIVNDLPVMEGTVIDGATVEEILADRVRFSFPGGVFEVKLEKLE